MREFFYPSSVAVFGVGAQPGNLAKNIVLHSQEMGFQGRIHFIDGIVLCHMYEPEMTRMLLRGGSGSPEQILTFFEQLCESAGKPIALSFFGRREKVEELRRTGLFPVFNDPMESVRAMRMLLEHGLRVGARYEAC